MKRILCVTTLLALCASTALATDAKIPVILSKEKPAPTTVIVPDPIKIATETWQRTGEAKMLAGRDGKVLVPFGESAPFIICSVNHVCDIELQAGETVQNVAVGDTARWYLQPAQSGSGSEITPHIIVKPTQGGLETNLILTTDKRTYYLTLKSSEKEYVTRISFYYPNDLVQSWNKATQAKIIKDADKVADTSPDKFDFSYSVSGSASFKPERVFSDGTHVYIQMPASLSSGEAPVLTLTDSSGATQLVNYRVLGRYYVVDRLFDKAVLITGNGSNQQKITISKKSDGCFLLDCLKG